MKKLTFLITLLLAVSMTAFSQGWVQLAESSSGTLTGSRYSYELLDTYGNSTGSQYGNSIMIYTAPEDISDCDSVHLCIASPDSVSISHINAFQWLRYKGTPTGCDSILLDTTTTGVSVNWLAATYTDTNAIGHIKFVRAPQLLRLYSIGKWIQFRFTFAGSANHYVSGTRGAYVVGTEKIRFYLKKYKHGG